MWFTCLCPYCGALLRLLRKLTDHKIMCPDCRRPFIAHDSGEEDLEGDGDHEEWPARGWLVVCPSCGHTELVSAGLDRRTHCPRCDSALPIPGGLGRRVWHKRKS